MANLTGVKIFPPIGIARLGNSPEYFTGPEIPFPAPPPAPPGGKYKDDQCRIKRQAQRFRLYGFYDDSSVNELTLADGMITWTVHVANAKPMKLESTIIDPGPRTLTGANDVATFADGKYTFGPASTEVPLGEAHTDAQGRLIVVGGFGSSGSLAGVGLTKFHNESWYDDTSDGSVNATIVINGTPWQAAGAWVICPPPHYAPTVQTVTSLYDTIRQEMIDQGKLPAPGQPSFANDIWPILKRAMDAKRVAAGVFSPGDHDTVASVIGPGIPPDIARKTIFEKLTPPGVTIPYGQTAPANMPRLYPCDPPTGNPDLPAQDVPPDLRQFQYDQMLAWRQGNFIDDYPGAIPALTPDGLTRAALEPCVGAVFYPGIEASISIRTSPYTEPFRLKQGAGGISPGDLTKDMARPWHVDFTWCAGGTQPDQQSWWPAARPDSVYALGDLNTIVSWDRGIAYTPDRMVANWFRLGFMLPDPGTGDLVETDRNVVCKDTYIITDRNTFGKDEIDAMLVLANPAVIDAAFYVVVEGFLPSDLGISNPHPPAGDPQFNSAPAITPPSPVDGMTFQVTALKCEDDTLNPNVAQRFTFFYQVHFTKTDAFPVEHQDYPITATIKGLSAQATLTLTVQPNPFMVDGPVSWLSTDVRVFQIRPNESLAGLPTVTMGNTPDDTYAFIQTVIKKLPANPSVFQNLRQDETLSQLELSETVNGVPVFNFALCRVRYFAKTTPASGVRVFFRLFQTAATGTNYDPNTSYRQGGHPGVKVPVLGVQGGELVTIPCFAEKRINVLSPMASLNAQTDLTNVQQIDPDASGKEVDAYFGCWLDINQPGQPLFPIQPASPAGPFPPGPQNRSIRDLVRGLHQCLVAEIAFDSDPITPGSSTASSDKLAQRNLAIVQSANPGDPASHRVQHTFDVKPARAAVADDEKHDELMIDWGATPPGSIATIYVPDVKVAEVLDIASRTFNLQTLERVDDHTLRCKTAGVTYVPLPPGATAIAGLLTVDLPPTVRKGQVFKIVVRQVTTAPAGPPTAISRTALLEAIRVRDERARAAATGALVTESATAVVAPPKNARRVLGAFQITVPVSVAREMLPGEERGLATARAILRTIPEENRWYLPFRRYVTEIADRVDALGGNSRGGRGGPYGTGDGDGERGHGKRGHGDRDRDRDRDERRGCVAMILHFLLRPSRKH